MHKLLSIRSMSNLSNLLLFDENHLGFIAIFLNFSRVDRVD